MGENNALREAVSKSIDRFLLTNAPSLQKLQEIIKSEVATLKTSVGLDYPEERVELILDWLFNGFRLNKHTLTKKGGENLSDWEKEFSARTQQGMVHGIFYTSTQEAAEEYISTMYHVVRATVSQISRIDKHETTLLRSYWNGIKHQLAAVRALSNYGYRVFLPNYSQDPVITEEEDNAVLQLDVRNGIDLIALSPEGYIILVDVTGRQPMEEAVHSSLSFKRVVIDQYRNPLVRQAVKDIATKGNVGNLLDVYRTILYLPSEGRSFKSNELMSLEARDTLTQKTQLGQFGLLQDRVQEGIISQLQFAPFMLR